MAYPFATKAKDSLVISSRIDGDENGFSVEAERIDIGIIDTTLFIIKHYHFHYTLLLVLYYFSPYYFNLNDIIFP